MSSRIQSAPVKSRNAGTRISVVVRVRPPNQREIASAQGNVIHVLDDRVLIFDPPGERVQKLKCVQTSQSRAKNLHFGFDKVLSPENTQEDVFDVVKNSMDLIVLFLLTEQLDQEKHFLWLEHPKIQV